MEKVFAGQNDCNIFDEVFSNENILTDFVDFSGQKSGKTKTLVSQIKYLNSSNTFINSNFGILSINDELSDKKIRQIAYELALAIDKNSVSAVKQLKSKYGQEKEFLKAKEFLNQRCKEVWDVFENKEFKTCPPHEAMKVLGITNHPSLDFLLENSLNYFEKDNGSTTVSIILSILNNKNLNYSFDDIYNFLKTKHQKEQCKYNLITVSYLASKLDFNKEKLYPLGVEQQVLNDIYKSLPLKDKLKYFFKNYTPLNI